MMFFKPKRYLASEAGGEAGAGASPPPATAPVSAPAPTAPSPAPAPTWLQPDASGSPAASPPAGAPPAAPAAAGDEFSWLPAKYRVLDADGKVDVAASSAKLGAGYANMERRMGAGDVRPQTATEYQIKVPEAFKEADFGTEFLAPFRDEAHRAGLTQPQFDLVVDKFFELVPKMLDGSAKLNADQARNELSKVWATPSALNEGLTNASRALAAMPAEMREQITERYGTDPLFYQFAAHWGAMTKEGSPPVNPGSASGSVDVKALMASPAYSDPKHADHAAVSARVMDILKRQHPDK